MPNIRLLPPPNVQYQTISVNGRSYTAAAGSVLDVVDFDALMLNANNWTMVAQVGPTSARPAATVNPGMPSAGDRYFDTTLNALIVYDGATWRSPITGAAV